jgi:hypothetical protein
MRIFWKRGDQLERALRAKRTEQGNELLQAAEEDASHKPHCRSALMCLVFGCVITGAFALSLGAFGALGYAASAGKHAAAQAEAVVAAVTQRNRAKDKQGEDDASLSSAQGQFGKHITICHHREAGNATSSITMTALPAYLALGDTIGACS